MSADLAFSFEARARVGLHWPELGFNKVINVGHNRVFQRRA